MTSKNILILSWNVAGLSTTVKRIHDNYKNDAAKNSSPTQSSHHPASVLEWFFWLKHQADIICMQEHKISCTLLTNRAEICQASNIPGYESFWSCCVDPACKGMNGVVTYVRKGIVTSANAAPLNCPELDRQGRCIRTDHGSTLCIFNVYVPNANGFSKFKFLRELRRAMQQQREQGKQVILVGDLNIAAETLDIYWKNRVVNIHDILQEATPPFNKKNKNCDWMRDVAQHWSQIVAALETKEVVATQTSNPRTLVSYNKYRLAVTNLVGESVRRVFLGNHELTPECCACHYELQASNFKDDETGESIQCREDYSMSVGILTELMHKIAAVEWSEITQREIADNFAIADRQSPMRKWLIQSILRDDCMVDAFRHFYPTAEGRFTCWNQNKNNRYSNEGARIDYTLIDESLLPFLEQGSDTLRCCYAGLESAINPLSENAALRACTANGCFQPVSFEGGGITEASRETLETQFGQPHTGHIYTPPTFSDHIGVSMLLRCDILPNRNYSLKQDAATRKAQPHKRQKSIVSFFQANSETTMKSSSDTATPHKVKASTSLRSDNKRVKRPSANSILHHFPLAK